MSTRSARVRLVATIAVAGAVALTTAFSPVVDETVGTVSSEFRPQLVTVDTPTEADRDRLDGLGLDVTEHAGHGYVEVVLHTAAHRDALAAAGFDWNVRIPDLVAREAEIQRANAAYAASVESSPLPSGRTTYRTLADYEADIDAIARQNPDIARVIELPHESVEGRTIRGLEIATDVRSPASGRPVFALFGLHHAREWPSGELAIEFAYDLVQHHGQAGPDGRRITGLLDRARVVIVPVVNPDGFRQSVNDGMLLDLRELDGGGTVSILATPNNAYKRKNCRVVDGQDGLPLACDLLKSPGGYGAGIDLNRNYGAFHGGPGASDTTVDPTYHGPGPFSEPETQNVRALASSRHVTTMISNHTFSNLVLRPNGVSPDTIGPDGFPVGFAPDEEAMKQLGARFAEQNGYANIHGWELYDTTGTTEDYTYNATGGYGYTFEIGPSEFHPPYPEVVDEYVGAGEYADRGNREAYLIALENTVDTAHHSVLSGTAHPGATLRLTREGAMPTWEGSFSDTVETTMTVPASGEFTWHVNPSTRPIVQSRQYRVVAEEPTSTFTTSGTMPVPGEHVDVAYPVPAEGVGSDLLEIRLDWALPDDVDLYVFEDLDGNGQVDEGEPEAGSSTSFVNEKEEVRLDAPLASDYVIRVENFAAASPTWTVSANTYEAEQASTPGMVEEWTMTCEVDGDVLQTRSVEVERGDAQEVALPDCAASEGEDPGRGRRPDPPGPPGDVPPGRGGR